MLEFDEYKRDTFLTLQIKFRRWRRNYAPIMGEFDFNSRELKRDTDSDSNDDHHYSSSDPSSHANLRKVNRRRERQAQDCIKLPIGYGMLAITLLLYLLLIL